MGSSQSWSLGGIRNAEVPGYIREEKTVYIHSQGLLSQFLNCPLSSHNRLLPFLQNVKEAVTWVCLATLPSPLVLRH